MLRFFFFQEELQLSYLGANTLFIVLYHEPSFHHD